MAAPLTPFSCAGYAIGQCGIADDWVGSATDYRAGAVMFIDNGSTLDVYLTNASGLNVTDPTYILTALFFDIAGNPTLTPVSATLFDSGSAGVTFTAHGGITWDFTNATATGAGAVDVGPADNNVGGEWGYVRGTTQLRSGAGVTPGDGPRQGISSTGLGIFSDGTFGGTNLGGPGAPSASGALDGQQFGLTSLGDTCLGCSKNLQGNNMQPITQGVIHFVLTGFSGFNISDIDNVLFQYGTATNEPFTWPNCVDSVDNPQQFLTLGAEVAAVQGDCGGTNEVPEPASLILVGSGFLGLAGFLRRKLS